MKDKCCVTECEQNLKSLSPACLLVAFTDSLTFVCSMSSSLKWQNSIYLGLNEIQCKCFNKKVCSTHSFPGEDTGHHTEQPQQILVTYLLEDVGSVVSNMDMAGPVLHSSHTHLFDDVFLWRQIPYSSQLTLGSLPPAPFWNRQVQLEASYCSFKHLFLCLAQGAIIAAHTESSQHVFPLACRLGCQKLCSPGVLPRPLKT